MVSTFYAYWWRWHAATKEQDINHTNSNVANLNLQYTSSLSLSLLADSVTTGTLLGDTVTISILTECTDRSVNALTGWLITIRATGLLVTAKHLILVIVRVDEGLDLEHGLDVKEAAAAAAGR